MANNESGNVVNANNFVEKLNVIDRRQAEYKPTNPAIKPEALTPVGQAVKECIETVSLTKTVFTKATANRKKGYEAMEDKATRAIHLLSSSEATNDKIKQGKALLSKFKSERVGELPDEAVLKAEAAAKGEEAVIPKIVSVSQQGYINRLAHFRDIIIFLKTVPAYKPNEADLTTEALETFAASVEEMNGEKNRTTGVWLNAIAERNKVMYSEPDGAYYLSVKMMEYVAGAYGKKSDFYKELLKYPVRNS